MSGATGPRAYPGLRTPYATHHDQELSTTTSTRTGASYGGYSRHDHTKPIASVSASRLSTHPRSETASGSVDKGSASYGNTATLPGSFHGTKCARPPSPAAARRASAHSGHRKETAASVGAAAHSLGLVNRHGYRDKPEVPPKKHSQHAKPVKTVARSVGSTAHSLDPRHGSRDKPISDLPPKTTSSKPIAAKDVPYGSSGTKPTRSWGLPGVEWHTESRAQGAVSHHMHRDIPSLLQTQEQAYRSVEASRQMIYDIFTWTIASIETLEKMEHHGQWRSSDMRLSDSSKPFYKRMTAAKRTETEMIEQCNTYLDLLRVSLRGCHPGLRHRGDLQNELFAVAQVWAETGVNAPGSNSRTFKAKLLEVLNGRNPSKVHTAHTLPSDWVSDQSTRSNTFWALQQGMTQTEALDAGFRDDPRRRAYLPAFRDRDYM